MKKRGFTIVELLGVITILGIILGAAITGYIKITEHIKITFYKGLEGSMYSAGGEYYAYNKNKQPIAFGNTETTSLGELISGGYIEDVLDRNKKKCDYSNSKVIAYKNSYDKVNYSVCLICPDDDYSSSGTCDEEIYTLKTRLTIGDTKTLYKENSWSNKDVYFQFESKNDVKTVELKGKNGVTKSCTLVSSGGINKCKIAVSSSDIYNYKGYGESGSSTEGISKNVLIDKINPTFEIENSGVNKVITINILENNVNITNKVKNIEDTISGINYIRYSLEKDGTSEKYIVPNVENKEFTISQNLTIGKWNLVIEAVDNAKNKVVEKVTYNINPIYIINLDNQGATNKGTETIYEAYNVGWYSNRETTSLMQTITSPTKTGYIFGGYYTSTDGSGTQIIDENGNIKVNSKTFSANSTIYAKWIANKIKIQLDMNGGTLSSSHGSRISTSGSLITVDGSNIIHTINYGEKIGDNGLANYNNSSWINIVKSGYKVNAGSEWNSAANGSGTSYNQDTNYNASDFCNAGAGDCTKKLYVNWVGCTYTVIYNGNGATSGTTASSTHTYDIAKNLTANEYTKAYKVKYEYKGATGGNTETFHTSTYTFNGWATSETGNKVYNNQASVTNLTNTCDGTYNLYGNWSSKSITLPTPTKTGHTFKGWYTEESFTNKVGDGGNSYTPTGNITLYAKWDKNSYYLDINGLLDGTSVGNTSGYGTFDVYINGSSVANDVADYWNQHPYGTSYEIKDIKATTGHTYEGVSSGSLSGTIGQGQVNVQLKYKTNTYTVTLSKQSGSGGSDSVTATYGSAMPSATMPTRSGYAFDGYYDQASGGTQYYTATGTSARNWDKVSATTLYARWSANTYTVTLDKQSGSGGSNSVTATYGSTMPSATAPTRSDYQFGGYFTETNGGGTQYYNKSMGSVRVWDLTSNTTLYAKWCHNCASVSNGSCILTVSSAGACSYTTSCNTGYTISGNGTRTPSCTANTYTVTLDKQSGSGGSNSVTATYGSAMPSATMPTRNGYFFDGYYDQASGGNQYYTSSGSSARNWNKASIATLYAHWIPIATIPTAANYCYSLTYTGGDQTLVKTAGTGYTWTSATTGKAADDYNVTATLNSGYRWSDNTTGTKTITCSIAKATPIITLSATSGTVVKDGTITFTEKSNKQGTFTVTSGDTSIATVSSSSNGWVSNDTEKTVTLTGVKDGTTKITVKLTPDSTNCTETTTTYTITVTKKATIPTVANYCYSLTYTGGDQTLVKTAGTGYTWTSATTGKAADDYNVTATLNSGYRWSDNTTGTKSIKCNIAKATPTITLSEESGRVIKGDTITFNEKSNKIGTFTVKSSDESIATVSQKSNGEIAADTNNRVTVTSKAVGKTTITVTFTPTSSNYKATTATYTIRVTSVITLDATISGSTVTVTCNASESGDGIRYFYVNDSDNSPSNFPTSKSITVSLSGKSSPYNITGSCTSKFGATTTGLVTYEYLTNNSRCGSGTTTWSGSCKCSAAGQGSSGASTYNCSSIKSNVNCNTYCQNRGFVSGSGSCSSSTTYPSCWKKK